LANYLQMTKREQVKALLQLGWSYRRIQRETGVRRETIAGYDPRRPPKPAKVFPGSSAVEVREDAGSGEPNEPNPAKVFPGSEPNPAKAFPGSKPPSRSGAATYEEAIRGKLDLGLSAQRIWQDLVADFGYGQSYESVKRLVRTLVRQGRAAVGVMHSAPGEEAQVDFFQGAPTLQPETGQWARPWVFRMTLCHSRHGYEEAVCDQKVETFLRVHERAFHDLGGVPQVIRHDNLKAAVVRACLFDPDVNPVYAAFGKHWGFTPLPTRPRNPQENGKAERSGGYVKDNALKGHKFNNLAEQNEHLRKWNRTIARLRIHGTTRRQVWTHYLETDKPALQPLAAERFAYFAHGTRIVHPDAHVEVAGSFYPVPGALLGASVKVRWDSHFVRVYAGDDLVASHMRVGPGQFASAPGAPAPSLGSSQTAFLHHLLGRCLRVGEPLHAWAKSGFETRGVQVFRSIQGALDLLRKHPRERVLWAAGQARDSGLFRSSHLRRLVENTGSPTTSQPLLLECHPSIRPITDYRLEDFL